MNYLSQINSFERWLETNYLPISSQLLWYKLIALCNRCGWAEWVTVDNQRLMAVMQIKREATFIDIRDKLISAGLIEYQKGKKGSPNKYKLYTFKSEVQSVVETVVNSVVNTEVETVVNTVDINKLNETKLNNITPLPPKGEKSEVFKSFANGDEALLLALQDYEKMRKAIKKPMTDRAKSMLLTELTKLSTDPKTQVAILEQSILHNWQTVYALKTDKSEPPKKKEVILT